MTIINADCVIAEKDVDLMNLYQAIIEQMKIVPQDKLIFSDHIDRLCRVIFPGRFVDYLALSIKNSANLSDLPEIQRSIMEKISKPEADFMVAVGCQIIALYLRDSPESDSLRSSYRLMVLVTRSNGQSCNIL